LLIIATLIGSYVTGRHFFAKAGYNSGFRRGRADAQMEALLGITSTTNPLLRGRFSGKVDTLLTTELIADSIRNYHFARTLAAAGVDPTAAPRFDPRLAAREDVDGTAAPPSGWVLCRFSMVPASRLCSGASRPELDTMLVPSFVVPSVVTSWPGAGRWYYVGIDGLVHYVR